MHPGTLIRKNIEKEEEEGGTIKRKKIIKKSVGAKEKRIGPGRGLNPGPLAYCIG
jgi:hypothetical protein